MSEDRIIAVGLLTARDLDVLGTGFRRMYPVADDGTFSDLIRALDEADRDVKRAGPSGGQDR